MSNLDITLCCVIVFLLGAVIYACILWNDAETKASIRLCAIDAWCKRSESLANEANKHLAKLQRYGLQDEPENEEKV